MSKRKTTVEFINEYKLLNKPVEIIGEYITSHDKILCKCLLCGDEFKCAPTDLLSGQIHGVCGEKIGCLKHNEKSRNMFSDKLYSKNPNLEIINEYIDVRTPIKIKCNICDSIIDNRNPNQWLTYPNCPVCSGWKRKTESEVYDVIKDWSNNLLEYVGGFTQITKDVEVLCKKCGNIYFESPYNIKRYKYNGCKKCEHIGRSISSYNNIEDVALEINQLNSHLFVVDYIGAHSQVTCECDRCKQQNSKSLYSWRHFPFCQNCDKIGRYSYGEYIIRKYCIEKNIKFNYQQTFEDLRGKRNKHLPFDFYLKDYNLLIEFNGMQHYFPCCFYENYKSEQELMKNFNYRQELDKKKKNYALNNKYNFLEIKYDEVDDIYTILDNYLNN